MKYFYNQKIKILKRRSIAFLSAVATLASVTTIVGADAPGQWPAFQNSGQTVIVSDAIPTKWSADQNVAWTSEIPGYGQSTPIVANDQVVVTSTSGENKDNYHVASYAIETGKKLWQFDAKNPSPFANTPMVSRAAPSAIATTDGFIAFFEGGVVVALDKNGQKIWEKDLVALYGPIEARHGLASSLEQNTDNVFVWIERTENPYLLALDKRSGDEFWKAPGVGATSWSSPRLIPVGDQQHLVCSASGKIVGYDPATGNRLWGFTDISNNSSCTPMPVGSGTFLMGASDGRGETTPGAAAESNGLIEVVPQSDGTFHVGFKWRATKATATFGSPIVVGKTAAIVNRTGVLYRFDLETGEQTFMERTEAGGIWATPIVAGEHLYLFGYKGTTSVIDLKDNREIAKNRLWEAESEESFGGGKVLYAAAPAPPYLFLRRGDMLYAIKQL
jgi:outer membrane protein assembly factor BamB